MDDDIEFALESGVVGFANFSKLFVTGVVESFESPLQTFLRLRTQKITLGHPARHRKVRQHWVTELDEQVAANRDLHTVLNRFRYVRKQLCHLLRTAQILLLAVVAWSSGTGHFMRLMDTHTHLMSIKVAALNEAHIVCRHYRTTGSTRERQHGLNIAFFIRSTGALQLEIKAFRKQFHPSLQTRFSFVLLLSQQSPANIAKATTR